MFDKLQILSRRPAWDIPTFLPELILSKIDAFVFGLKLLVKGALVGEPKRVIHIHPGVVPDVKGADGILWSSLVHQRIGMSAFFMNEGIDTGDIIATREYDIPVIIDDKTQADGNAGRIADFIVNEVDPIFRADLLGRLFLTDRDPRTWQFQRQNPDDGKTYYFMHDQLKKLAIENWCDSRPA